MQLAVKANNNDNVIGYTGECKAARFIGMILARDITRNNGYCARVGDVIMG